MAHELQTRYGTLIDDYLRANLWSENIINNKYEGDPKAGLVKIPQRTEANVRDYVRATGIAPDQSTTDYADLFINFDKAVNEVLDGYEIDALPDNVVADRLESAAYSLMNQIDIDRFADMVSAAKGGTESTNTTQLTASNASATVLGEIEELDNAKVPQQDRWMVVTPAVYTQLLQDTNFILASDLGQDMKVKGQVGEYYGLTVYKSVNMPTTTAGGNTLEFIIGHKQNNHSVKEWKIEPKAVNLDGDANYVGAIAIKGRYVYGNLVSRDTTVRIKGYL